MKTSHTILLDLLAGQSTVSALAERMHQPERILAAFLEDLLKDGLVEFAVIKNTLPVWRITSAGRDLAHTLQPISKP